MLAILYETDHRPSTNPCVVRKDFPSGLGGSDICHFCAKRVYVMERLSAEGFFFHRECFRCDVCKCTLRLGGHTFDSREAKFFCKMHYAQRQSNSHGGRFRRRLDDQTRVSPSSLDGGSFSASGGGGGAAAAAALHPPGGASSLPSAQIPVLPEDTEMAEEAQDDSFVDLTSKVEDAGKNKDHGNKHNHRWKRKIRATFPLLFIKPFQRSWHQDKDAPETVPEADSDFEEIAENKTVCDGAEKRDKTNDERQAATTKSAPQKTRLKISASNKEKLLNWDEETPNKMDANVNQNNDAIKEQAETKADKPHGDSGQDGEATPSQTHSAFQVLANAFRRRFSVSNPSSGAAVKLRPKRGGPHKQRPMSEGAFSFTSLFNSGDLDPSKEDRKVRLASLGADPWGAGRDLPSLLQQVSLKGRRDSGGVFNDDAGSQPRRRVDLFSSLRIRKREASLSDGKDGEVQKEIKTILSNLRNKASSKENLEEPSSSDDENENLPHNQKSQLVAEKQKRKQEKIVAQQTKREQLKRLHRAQVIQRQLEEVGEKQRDLEERGVSIEKIIRGETKTSPTNDDDEAELYQSWFKLVLEKNRLARYESELMIFAQELELEDTQSRLQQDLRRRMAVEDTKKSASELQEEQEILLEIMRTVERRDMLVSILEEQRLKERAEDKDLESLVLSKGYEFHWAQSDDSWGQEKLE